MAGEVLVTKGTDAASGSKEITKESLPMSLSVDGTLVDEVITIKLVGADGLTANATDSGDTLTLASPSLGIFAPCWIFVEKPSTANAVGVMLRG